MRKTHLFLIGLLCSFAVNAANDIPRPEYPRPQFERAEWVNLNGEWTYELDLSNSGRSRELHRAIGFGKTITVPFCPESSLSGVHYTDFIDQMWYQRSFFVPSGWKEKTVLLNFGGVDYYTMIYIDGKFAGSHYGGSSSFSVDITRFVKPGNTHNLVLFVADNPRSGLQSIGKQSTQPSSYSCFYTRVTGIWQTVWMEAVSPSGLKSAVTTPDIDREQLIITPEFYQADDDKVLEVAVYDGKTKVAQYTTKCANGANLILPIKKMKLWTPENPNLYDITYCVKDLQGNVLDKVQSYVGMRKVHTASGHIYLNNKPYFQRLVMNQGYYPDGIWTAPTDEALKNDILLSKSAGFNGARLHQKVFEERFHYWADKLGFITWAESPNWGMNSGNEVASRNFISEWTETVIRDRNHPSIIVWTPFNFPSDNFETETFARLTSDVYKLTKAIDPTRPMNTVAGITNATADILCVVNYEPDPATFSQNLRAGSKEPGVNGKPYILGEFGGIYWSESTAKDNSWGYGGMLTNEEGFYERLKGFMNAIEANTEVAGFCYTQLTDIEQEKNGIYYYDRRPKLDMQQIKAIFERIPSFRAEKKE